MPTVRRQGDEIEPASLTHTNTYYYEEDTNLCPHSPRTLPALVSPRADEANMGAVDQGMRKLAEICERAKCTGPDPKERPVDAFEKLIKVC